MLDATPSAGPAPQPAFAPNHFLNLGSKPHVHLPELTETVIEDAFAGTNFGTRNYRELLEQGVLKSVCGYHSGHTLTQIMLKLGLRTPKGALTKKGKALLMDAFYRAEHCG